MKQKNIRDVQSIGGKINQLYDLVMAVQLTPAAARQMDKLPRVIRARVMSIIQRLERWPAVSGAKPLSGNLAGRHRIRTGDYRVQFYVRGDVVVIERIGHRDGFYKD